MAEGVIKKEMDVSLVESTSVTTSYGNASFRKYSNGVKSVEISWSSFPARNSKTVVCSIPDGYKPLRTNYLFGLAQNNSVIAFEATTSGLNAYESSVAGIYLKAIYE